MAKDNKPAKGKTKGGSKAAAATAAEETERRIKAATFDWAKVVPEVRAMPVTSLVPYEANPRKNDKAVKPLSNSVHDFGFLVPVVVDNFDHMELAAGHTRLKSILQLCAQEGKDPASVKVNVVSAEHLTPDQLRAFRIADNKVAELAEWDEELLLAEITALPDFDFGDFGFDLDELAGGGDADTEEDDFDVDEEPEEIRIHRGEVYSLGGHRLMCGDSTSPSDVAKLMNGEKAECVITDPPYNVAYEGKNGMTIENDSMEDKAFREFLVAAFRNLVGNLNPGGSAYIWHADSEGFNFRGACHDVDLPVVQCLIWKKNSLVLGRQDYQWIHEPCLYCRAKGAAHRWYGDRKQTTVLEFDKPRESSLHPTMKPIALFAHLAQNSTKRGDLILDLFGGSGTSVIVAERMGRRCNLMEYDEKYATRIIERWEAETGRKAELIAESSDPDAGNTEDGQ